MTKLILSKESGIIDFKPVSKKRRKELLFIESMSNAIFYARFFLVGKKIHRFSEYLPEM